MNLDPDRACPHTDFRVMAMVHRIKADACTLHPAGGGDGVNVTLPCDADCPDRPVIAYSADVTVACSLCGEPFTWIGLPIGLLPDRPTVDVRGQELRAPLRPSSAVATFGRDVLPGFHLEPPE